MIRITGISIERFSEWAKFSRGFNTKEFMDKENEIFRVSFMADDILVMSCYKNNISLVNNAGETFSFRMADIADIEMV